jgi:DNA-binding transcriptional MerR regulator
VEEATVEEIPTPEYLTKSEVAALFRVSPNTLDRWEAKGIAPPSIKLPSGRRRYVADEVRQHLVGRRAAS